MAIRLPSPLVADDRWPAFPARRRPERRPATSSFQIVSFPSAVPDARILLVVSKATAVAGAPPERHQHVALGNIPHAQHAIGFAGGQARSVAARKTNPSARSFRPGRVRAVLAPAASTRAIVPSAVATAIVFLSGLAATAVTAPGTSARSRAPVVGIVQMRTRLSAPPVAMRNPSASTASAVIGAEASMRASGVPVRRIPQADRLVGRCGDEPRRAAGRRARDKAYGADGGRVAGQGADRFAGGQIPKGDGALGVAGGRHFAVGTDRPRLGNFGQSGKLHAFAHRAGGARASPHDRRPRPTGCRPD